MLLLCCLIPQSSNLFCQFCASLYTDHVRKSCEANWNQRRRQKHSQDRGGARLREGKARQWLQFLYRDVCPCGSTTSRHAFPTFAPIVACPPDRPIWNKCSKKIRMRSWCKSKMYVRASLSLCVDVTVCSCNRRFTQIYSLALQDIKTVLDKHNNGESDTAIDVEYYENTLKKLVVAKARAVGRLMHVFDAFMTTLELITLCQIDCCRAFAPNFICALDCQQCLNVH